MSGTAVALRLTCPTCGTDSRETLLELDDVPVFCNVLLETRAAAELAPRADLRLVFCERCATIWNAAFDPSVVGYAIGYENSLHFSPTFQRYAESLAERLIARYRIRGKAVIDVGAGTGEFLDVLAGLGGSRGIGFDPSHPDDERAAGSGSVRLVQDFYGERHADLPADLVCCRHVLEHVPEPLAFLAELRRTLGNRPETVLYVEVPAAEYVLGEVAVYDLIYEHFSVFSEPALRNILGRAGFRVLDAGLSFGGQYLWAEAVPGQDRPSPPDVRGLRELARAFEPAARERIERGGSAIRPGGSTVVWGAGSKGVTFLNLVPGAAGVELAVDVSPRKWGRYVPGTAQRVVPPGELPSSVDTVVVMNRLYEDEVRQDVRAYCSRAEVVVA